MNKTKKTQILWLKRVIGSIFVGLWIVVLYQIFHSGGSFQDQAPKCIFSTMLIFGLLTVIHKGLEYLERQD